MFGLAVLEDCVFLEPSEFGDGDVAHLIRAVKDKYVDKVVRNVGLVVAFYDVVRVISSRIPPSDGRAACTVRFRLVVFKPFEGEVLEGTVVASGPAGIQVSLGFFQDVRIPSRALRAERGFDAERRLWWWEFDGQRLHYQLHQPLRFAVTSVTFAPQKGRPGGNVITAAEPEGPPPMGILVSRNRGLATPPQGAIDRDGLGMRSWWRSG